MVYGGPVPAIDPAFLTLRDAVGSRAADAALTRARQLGATHADVRLHRMRTASLSLRDARLESATDTEALGLAVRVLVDGTWGFAGGVDRTPEAAVALAEQAVATAAVSRALRGAPMALAPEDAVTLEWCSAYDIDPFDIAPAERAAFFADICTTLLAAGVEHVDAGVELVKENSYYCDTAGTVTTQQRVRVLPRVSVFRVDNGRFSSQRSTALPAGRGWEFVTGSGAYVPGGARWDFAAEVAELPELLAEHAGAPTVEPGRYDLVIDPTNLWLTIHESIGHATELDRAVGYEAAYAGTSFATPDLLDTLQYGSAAMHVVGDRTTPHGLASVGADDEGVPTQEFDIVKGGVLVGYQLNRQIAAEYGFGRSNGCAYADSGRHIPLQRMANVSLQPSARGPSTAELIAGVERGIYVVGDKSWSIDQQRFNFQFTGQRFFRIANGRLAGALRDVAYQATTTDFWGSMAAIGGPQTYALGGALNCGKGQPGQVAPVSHGSPSALFTGVNVLNTAQEGRA